MKKALYKKNNHTLARLTVLLTFLCLASPVVYPVASAQGKSPRLVVMIAVDGLGADIFDRYDASFTGGFRRLKEQGMRFTNASVDHAMTISHPGHVTLSTGVHPSRHGIVDAAFYQRAGATWKYTDAVRDTAEQIVGASGSPGVSPGHILASGLPEWIMSADSRARFVAIGTGRYSSLLHAARARGDVYWFDETVGRYVTSSYYRQDYPDWVERFNRAELKQFMEASSVWQNTVPEAARGLARRDDAPYEGYEGHTTFPHSFKDAAPNSGDHSSRAFYSWFADTPLADAATLALAKEAVRERALGQRNSTDYLSIVVSQVDDISHSYGAGSQEQLDNMLRLDRELGEFFTFLDEKVGKGKYLVALSADHGMMDIPEYQREIGQTGRRITEREINLVLNEVRAIMSGNAGTREERAARVAEAVRRYDFVAETIVADKVLGSPSRDSFINLYRNSYRADRVPRFPLFDFSNGTSPIGEIGVIVRLKRGAIIDLDRAIHGSPYDYDRRVPLVFMGYGVRAGSNARQVRTVDVAPTLAKVAGIKMPGDLDGRPLLSRRK